MHNCLAHFRKIEEGEEVEKAVVAAESFLSLLLLSLSSMLMELCNLFPLSVNKECDVEMEKI